MRILYLHQYFIPPKGSGGTRSYEFARRLIADGHDVCMLTSSAMLPKEYQGLEKITQVEIQGISVVIIPVPYTNEMSFSQRVRAFLKFAVSASLEVRRHKADVVFATSTPLTIAIPGIAARLWQRIPMVFEVRDLWPELPIAVGALPNPVLQWAARALEWVAYHASAHVVALSPGMAEGVINRGIPRHRVTVIPNSCDVEIFDVPASRGGAIREKLGLADGQPLVLYAGTFGLINHAEYMVDLAAEVKKYAPEVRFLMVGGGAERDKVMAKAKSLGVYDHTLTMWESIPKDQMPDLLAAATVAMSMFMPLKPMWHNSANKFFDALAARKPIAINYGGWQADLLNETGAGMVLPPDNIPEAAAMLVGFVRDPARLQAASDASRHLAYHRFHRDKMAQLLLGVLKGVVRN